MDGRAAIVHTHCIQSGTIKTLCIAYCIYACPMYMYITEKDGCINEKLHCMHVQYIYMCCTYSVSWRQRRQYRRHISPKTRRCPARTWTLACSSSSPRTSCRRCSPRWTGPGRSRATRTWKTVRLPRQGRGCSCRLPRRAERAVLELRPKSFSNVFLRFMRL